MWTSEIFGLCSIFCIIMGKSALAGPIAASDDQIQTISTKSQGESMPNVTVVLHPPVVVPAMDLPEKPLPVEEHKMPPLGRPLAAVDSEFALVNGTPVFFKTTDAPAEQLNVVESSKVPDAESAERRNDTLTVAHAVLKAVEHFSNVSEQKPDLAPTVLNVGSNEPTTNTSGTASVSVVVVPLIQNAFDLPDHNGGSTAADMAAKNPLVISSKEGNHTTLHVVVKRAEPSAKHNFHGPLLEEETLPNATSQSHVSPKSSVVLIEKANAESSHLVAKQADLVTEHVDPSQNHSKNVDAHAFAKVSNESSTAQEVPLIEPPVLVPVSGPLIQVNPTAIGVLSNTSPEETSTAAFTPPFNFTVIIPTLPTLSPKQVASVAQPGVINPLPVGTFQFLQDDKHDARNSSATDLIHLQ